MCVETPENSLLQELLSHTVDKDAARGKQTVSMLVQIGCV
jgi:hypothetical protein